MTESNFSVKLTEEQKMSKNIDGFKKQISIMETLISERTNYNLGEFLKLVNIPHKTWRRWVTGETTAKPTIPQVKALCKELKLSVDELPDDFSEKYLPQKN